MRRLGFEFYTLIIPIETTRYCTLFHAIYSRKPVLSDITRQNRANDYGWGHNQSGISGLTDV